MRLVLRPSDWPVRVKMWALVIVVTLLPLAVATWIDIREARVRLVTNEGELLAARGDDVADKLDAFHRANQVSATTLTRLPLVLQYCRATPEERRRRRSGLGDVFDAHLGTNPNIRGVLLLDLAGRVTVATEAGLIGTDLSRNRHVHDALQGRPVISDIHLVGSPSGEEPTISYLAPVLGANGEPVAIAMLWVRASAVWDIMRKANELAGPGSFAVLFDRWGIRIGHSYIDTLVFHPAGRLAAATLDPLVAEHRFGADTRRLLEGVRPFPQQFDRALAMAPGREVFRGFAPVTQQWNYGVARRLESAPWTVFYMIPELGLNAEIAAMTRRKTLRAGGIIVFALVAGTVLAAAILRPISALSTATRRIAAGDLGARVLPGGRDELGRLVTSFNSMAERINAQTAALHGARDELELRVQERTAELRQKSADLEVQTAERERLAAIADSSQDAIISKDVHGIIVTWNLAAERLYGYSKREMVGQPLAVIVPPDRLDEELGILARVLRGDVVDHFETVRVGKGGRLIDVSVTVSPIKDRDGRIIAASKIARDITQQKRAKEVLQESEEYFHFLNDLSEATRPLGAPEQIMAVTSRMLGEHLGASRCAYGDVEPDGEQFTIMHDYTDGCATTVGRYQLSLFGPRAVATLHAGQTLIIRNVTAELSAGEGAEMFSAIGIQAIITCPLVKEGVLRAMMAVHQTVPRNWQPSEITIVRDVVERCWATIERRTAEARVHQLNAALEERVIERTAQLEAANKELEAFSYSVSHDLRAPLRAVDGFSQAVLDDYGPQLPAEGQRQLHTIRESAQRMGALIDDLLKFARLSRLAVNRQGIDTAKLVRTVLQDLGAPWPGRVIELRVGPLPSSVGDPALLKQVWMNLISNALKYTGKREKVVLEIGCVQTNGIDTFFVRDNGAGFDMRYADKLFGVFQRLHRAEDYEGTGVGLAIVQRVVHRHGGRVWADAAVDRGATFYFTLRGDTAA
ncbi:MAG: PAS domain S-box protein [Gemmatimonadota bacterium]